MGKDLKPGQRSPASGQGKVIGPRGGDTGREVTLVKGHTVPPTPKPGQTVRIVDRTRNKSGQGK